MDTRWLVGSAFTLIASGCSAAAMQPDASYLEDAGLDGGVDGGPDGGSVAEHAPFPQVVDNGGDLLNSPSLVTITFPGYEYEAQVQAFGDWIFTSNWMAAVGLEYDVGRGQHLKKVVLSSAAPAEFDEGSIGAFIANRIRIGQLPPPTEGILYMLYLPSDTIVTQLYNGQAYQVSCMSTFAAHDYSQVTSTSAPFAYAWVASCTKPVPNIPLPIGLDGVTTAASHELIEAATDPYGEGYHLLSYDYANPWALLGLEVGDLCVLSFATEDGYRLQRVWSNQAARLGGSPCVPVPAGVSYRGVSTSPGYVASVPAGKSIHFDVEGWSTSSGPWALSSFVWRGNIDPQFTLSGTQISNGDTLSLDLTVPADAALNSYFALMLLSTVSADETSIWPVGIDVQ